MPSSIVLVPPCVVLLLSLVTKRINEALFAGVCVAALIVTHWSIPTSISLILKKFLSQMGCGFLFNEPTSFENLYLFGFLIFLGIFISLLSHMGGMKAYGKLVKNIFNSRKSIETSSLVLSFLCMVDDYFSILTVGTAMRYMAKPFNIPHAKLAFLINAMGPTLCILCPITSWSAMLLGQLIHVGISMRSIDHPLITADPFSVYLHTIPYIFYSFITFCSTWFIVRKGISYGPMHMHERIAQDSGNLFGGKEQLSNNFEEIHVQGTITDFMLPVLSLIAFIFLSILYSGHYFGSSIGMARALAQANIFFALFLGTFLALVITIVWFFITSKCTFKDLKKIIPTGFRLMSQSIVMLLFANIFSDFIKNDLHTGEYIALYLGQVVSIPLLPFILFITSFIIAATTGASWASIAIMIPISVPILVNLAHIALPTTTDHILMLFPVLGAIISGAVAGTHVTPLSDNSIMASLSAGAYHTDHVKTQIWYILPSIIGCCLSFIIVGWLSSFYNYWIALIIALAIGIAFTLSLLVALHHRQLKTNTNSLQIHNKTLQNNP